MPKIPILIPAYNVEKYIARCLDSVIGQTFPDIEIIIVNDGSTDGTASIIDEYASRDSRIRVVNHPENCGVMWARKTSVESSEGDYLMFLDSDDRLKPDACERLYSAALDNQADLVICGYEIIKNGGKVAGYPNKLDYGSSSQGVIKAMLLDELRRYLWAKLYSRDLFLSHPVKYFRHHNLMEDEAISFQVSRHVTKAVLIPEALYEYHENMSSLTHRYPPSSIQCALRSQAVLRDISSDWDEELKRSAETFIIRKVNFLIKVNGGRDRGRIMNSVKDNGFGALFSFSSLVSHLGLRKGVNYFLLTHFTVISRIVYGH